MRTSKNGFELICRYEGFRKEAYRCPAGVWTIGYGHTGPEVCSGLTTTREEALQWLKRDVAWAEKAVNAEGLSLNQDQFDALVSFVFNVGAGNFRSSTLLKKIRENPCSPEIRTEFARWNKAKGSVLPGLVLRRKEEAELYFNT